MSTLAYEVETWTVSTAMNKRLEAFEIWCYRRVLKKSYVEPKRNEEALNMMKTKRSPTHIIRKRKAKYLRYMV